jgi:hypothetical protein
MCYMIISRFCAFLLDRSVINAGSAEIVIKAHGRSRLQTILNVVILVSLALSSFSRIAASAELKAVGDIPFQGESRALKLGFNLGYAHFVDGAEYSALKKVTKDGFRYIRVYELWQRGGRGKRNAIATIVENLGKLVRLGVTPIVSFSNFPFNEDAERSTHSINRADINAKHIRQRQRASRFTNRYPPSDLPAYLSTLDSLLREAENRFPATTMRQWLFEFGNEPAAPKFFWGSPEDYRRIVERSATLFKDHNPGFTTGFGGFSTQFVIASPGSEPYYRVLDELLPRPQIDFLSFHIYQDKFKSDHQLRTRIASLVKRAAGKRSMITEWNPGSKRSRRTQEVLSSTAFMGYLLTMAEICHEQGIELLLVHKLKDNPSRGRRGAQLGLIDAKGNEKAAYAQLKAARPVLEQGFQVYKDSQLRALGGPEHLILQALEPGVTLSLEGYRITAASFPFSDRKTARLGANDWMTVARETAR